MNYKVRMRKFFSRLLNFTMNLIPLRFAELLLSKLERRLGIGCGGNINRSGETVVFYLLSKIPLEMITIFDVGSNVGDYTEMAIKHLPDGVKHNIHCFEPSPSTFEIIKQRFQNKADIILNPTALGACSGTATLYMDTESSQLASLTKRDLDFYGIKHDSIHVEVTVDTLDNYAFQAGIESIDLLKIDVEGHEMDVLLGAKRLIDNGMIKFIQFEFGGCNIDTRSFFRDFYDYLIEKGYRIYRILPNRSLLPLPKYKETYEKFRTSNFLAVRNEIDLNKICRSIVV